MMGSAYGPGGDYPTEYTEVGVRSNGELVMTRGGVSSGISITAGPVGVAVGCHRLSWEAFDMLVDRIHAARARMPESAAELARTIARVDGWIDRLQQAVERAERAASAAREDERP
jgi:hypothetical protein